jgi:beta-phosphoglucomutase-like phosphatase (HAD superfamily)
VLERLGLTPLDAIAFEDSANGLAAAKAAGLFTVVIPTIWTAHEDLSGADLVLATLFNGGSLQSLSGLHAKWALHRLEAA